MRTKSLGIKVSNDGDEPKRKPGPDKNLLWDYVFNTPKEGTNVGKSNKRPKRSRG